MASPQRKSQLTYPGCDGYPRSEFDLNRLLMDYTEFVIKTRCADQPTGYVSANLFIYYEKGNPRKRVSPDVFYVKQAPKGLRERYLIWEEGFVPDVAFEYVAESSWRMDPVEKRAIYEHIGIPEYYVYDPRHRWLKPPLWAYRLENGKYVETKVESGEYVSPVLGLRMKVEAEWLRFYDATTGERCLTAEEQAQRSAFDAARAAEEARRADREAARADAGSAELLALKRENERLRRQLET
jgi:Uma2 family endonuclease